MNRSVSTRFVSVLLAALTLAAVSLAQPAHAQSPGKWYRGLPYFLNSNTQSKSLGTVVTAKITGSAIGQSDTGHVDISSIPASSPTYSTDGSYKGSVAVYYVWSGANPTSDMVLSATQDLKATRAGSWNSGGNSKAGTAFGQFTYPNPTGWNNTGTYTYQGYFFAGSPPQSVYQTASVECNTKAYYTSANPGSTLVTAEVTFGSPVVTH